MIDNYNKLVIFGYPRSGTKLLSTILSHKGYHRFGEFFDTWTSDIDIDKSIRMPSQKIEDIKNRLDINGFLEEYNHIKYINNRFTYWKNILDRYPKWSVTVWLENILQMPSLFLDLSDCYWLCPVRDPWEQLLSYLIVRANYNPDGDIDSKPIAVQYNVFIRQYWRIQRVKFLQHDIVSRKMGEFVQFDELISENNSMLLPYNVSSVDQHTDLKSYIQNITEVKEWYNFAEKSRIEGSI